MSQFSVSRQRHFGPTNNDIHEVMMFADQNGNIINTFGSASNIPLSAGNLEGYSIIHKFGRNPSIGGAPETIWGGGGVYTYLSSPAVVYCYSSSNDDGAGEIGARTVTIQGLDANYAAVEDTIVVDGAPSTVQFLRVFRAFVITSGSVGTNVGTLSISDAASSGTVVTTIDTLGGGTVYGTGQSFSGFYTIPAGKTGYMTQWNVGVGAYNNQCTAWLAIRPINNGSAFRTLDVLCVPGGHFTRNYDIPLKLLEKTDIEVRALCSTGSEISSTFDIILVDNEG